MFAATLPAIVLGLEKNILAATTRACDTIGPAMRYQIFPAVVGTLEVENRILKSVGFHDSNMSQKRELSTILLP